MFAETNPEYIYLSHLLDENNRAMDQLLIELQRIQPFKRALESRKSQLQQTHSTALNALVLVTLSPAHREQLIQQANLYLQRQTAPLDTALATQQLQIQHIQDRYTALLATRARTEAQLRLLASEAPHANNNNNNQSNPMAPATIPANTNNSEASPIPSSNSPLPTQFGQRKWPASVQKVWVRNADNEIITNDQLGTVPENERKLISKQAYYHRSQKVWVRKTDDTIIPNDQLATVPEDEREQITKATHQHRKQKVWVLKKDDTLISEDQLDKVPEDEREQITRSTYSRRTKKVWVRKDDNTLIPEGKEDEVAASERKQITKNALRQRNRKVWVRKKDNTIIPDDQLDIVPEDEREQITKHAHYLRTLRAERKNNNNNNSTTLEATPELASVSEHTSKKKAKAYAKSQTHKRQKIALAEDDAATDLEESATCDTRLNESPPHPPNNSALAYLPSLTTNPATLFNAPIAVHPSKRQKAMDPTPLQGQIENKSAPI